MPAKQKRSNLLPPGFRDMLPRSAEFEASLTAAVLAHASAYGYEQVAPPVLEFENTLLANKDEGLRLQTFRLMDPLSRQMLALRADMTPQVARIAQSRLKNEPRPLRLCYAGNVFRVQGEGLHTERQLRQAGAELVGANSAAADVEVVVIAATALEKVGFKNISVDFSLPGLAPAILDMAALNKKIRKNLFELIERKDIAAIKKLGGKNTATHLLEAVLRSAGDAEICLKKLGTLSLPKNAAAMVSRLAEVVGLLKKRLPKLTVTVDPLERRGFEYHKGITFSFFSADSLEELGRGGRYPIAEDNAEEAVGFSLIINTLQRNLKAPASQKRVLAEKNTSQKNILALQKKGYAVVVDIEGSGVNKKEARRQNCTFIFAKNKVSRA